MAGDRHEDPRSDAGDGTAPTWDAIAGRLPPEASALLGEVLADRDGNGTPDILEGHAAEVTQVSTAIHVDGRTYTSLDEVPEPARRRIRDALADPDQPAAVAAAGAPGSSAHGPIVTRAGWSSRSKLIATFVAIDVIVLAVVLIVVLR